MTIVVDASVVVAALLDGGEVGTWADALLAEQAVVAPHLMPVEVANVVRRNAAAGSVSRDAAHEAIADLGELRARLVPFGPCAARVWALRDNLSCYDAWYVAVAEAVDAPLATLDMRMAGAAGVRCEFLLPG
jgi:predicted nucleic acid-binding protein